MMKSSSRVFLFLAMLLIGMCMSAYKPIHAAVPADYTTMRTKYYNFLTGGSSYATTDPYIISKVGLINDNAETLWNSMNKSANRTFLWSDLAPSASSSEFIQITYSRLKAMTLALKTRGADLENNTTLQNDIILALDWLNANWYNKNTVDFDNWFTWELGAPMNLNDITLLLYDDLTSTQRTNYMDAVEHFTPSITWADGTNRAWQAQVLMVRGMIVGSDAKITAAKNGISALLTYQTSMNVDGFFEDGSYVGHSYFSYAGGYGAWYYATVLSLVYWLDNSPWEVTDANKANLVKWASEAFQPLIYKGAIFDFSRGRDVARYTDSDHASGHGAIASILLATDIASPSEAINLKRQVKDWIQSDTYRNYFNSVSIFHLLKAQVLMNDTSITPSGGQSVSKLFPIMDKAVYQRPGYAFGISMFSTRTKNYESINGENTKGWHQSDGMTHLYVDGELDTFSGNYWATVNPYRLPGTTVLTGTSNSSAKGTANWAGGSSLNNVYGAVGMELKTPGKTLTSKKSWFMLDNEIVALGADIISTDNVNIETVIENRKLNAAGNNVFTVNGTAKSTALNWSETMSNVNWMHLAGNTSGASIGYYFPTPTTLQGLRAARTGTWAAINQSVPYNISTSFTDSYLTLWNSHGTNPVGSQYAYVLLPNATSAQVANYAGNPEISVLANSGSVQAVKDNTLNLTAANFWTDTTVTSGGITSNKKASVMIKQNGQELELAVSDPTQANTGNIQLELNQAAAVLLSSDPQVTVTQLSPTVKLNINVAGAKGKTFKAKLSIQSALFSDNFEDGNADGWSTTGGTWSVVTDGSKMYSQTNTTLSSGIFATAGSASWTDYSVEAKIKPMSFPISTAVVGLVARYTDVNNRYNFTYSNGVLDISKRVNGVATALASKAYSLIPGTTYTFKAQLNGSTLELYVNGVKELTASDATFTSGKIGLTSYKSSVQFDDIVVLNQ
ncbi:polysaccharide lyase 8 family protein [Paenibacillus qinlingensis]|uniref:Hyaluronate lyase n=1 Tax=Paenibacillus qinlingensis TaxID=1837343 RepID=A0ABU1NTR3_9BACL|nr:polysaccharide lyase 8 family protein [Paenibacillus qinlingensis]MDR6550876.1 hyaluronate lyase [Paenibacillus qinlingensis]